jgi:disulfide bond formation protein DsbB
MFQAYFLKPDVRRSAILIGLVAAATLAGAWTFQGFGIVPCELCLKERIAYYGAVPLAAIVAYAATGRARSIAVSGLIGLAIVFVVNAGLGIYHSGVEWRLLQGPTDCTGSIAGPVNAADLLQELQHAKIVPCDEVQIRILWLSLANWNVVISAALAALAARAAIWQDGSPELSPRRR